LKIFKELGYKKVSRKTPAPATTPAKS
jgi:hypothetical protein